MLTRGIPPPPQRNAVNMSSSPTTAAVIPWTNYVQPRKVKVSAEAGEKVGIEQGLKSGERVVTGANFVVDSESRLKGAFAGMGSPSQAAAGTGPKQSISVEVVDPKTAKT